MTQPPSWPNGPPTPRETPAGGLPPVTPASGLGAVSSSGSARFRSLPGQQHFIGPYVVVGELGRGGMGVVYRVRAPTGEDLALKLLRPGASPSPERAQRFEREARVLTRLDHPQIVPLRDVGRYGGTFFMVTDLVEGEGDLEDYARRNRLSPLEAAELAIAIARVVQVAHDAGVIHRDIKPSNVLVDHLGRPHLLDFGLAFELGSAEQLTQTGAMMGTPAYMAPELVSRQHGEPSAASDVYSLGVILHELLCGQVVFPAESSLEYLMKLVERDAPGPRSVDAGVPASLDRVCRRALTRDPAQRYGSAGEFADALELAVGELSAPAGPRSGGLLTGLVGAALGVLATLGVLAARSGPAEVARATPTPAATPAASPPATQAPSPTATSTPAPAPALAPHELAWARLYRDTFGMTARQEHDAAIRLAEEALSPPPGAEPDAALRYRRAIFARGLGRRSEARLILEPLRELPDYRVRATLALVHVYSLRPGEREAWDRCFVELGGPMSAELPAERYAAQLGSILARSRAAIRAPNRAEVHESLWRELAGLPAPPSPELELEQLVVAVRVARGSVFRSEVQPTRDALDRLAAFEQERWVPYWERSYASHRSLLAAQAGAVKPALTNAKILLELDPQAFLPRVIHVVAMARAGRLDGLNRASGALQNFAKRERPDLAPTVSDLLSHWVGVGRQAAAGDEATYVGTLAAGSASRVRLGPSARAMLQVPISDAQARGQVVITCKGAESDVDLFLRYDQRPTRQEHDDAATSFAAREQLVLGPQSKTPSRRGVWVLVCEAAEPVPHAIDFVIQARFVPAERAVVRWETPWESVTVPDPRVREELQEVPRLRQQGGLTQARQKLLELTRRAPELKPLLGTLYRRLEDWRAILALLSEETQIPPGESKESAVPVWLATLSARAWLRLGAPQEAIRATEVIVAGRPLLLEGHELHLETLVALGQLEEAERRADALLAQDPTLDRVRFLRALAIGKRDPETGLKLIDELCQSREVAPSVRRQAVSTLMRSKALANADRGLKTLLEEKVRVPEDRYLLAELLWRVGERDRARALAEALGQQLVASPMTLSRRRALEALFKSEGEGAPAGAGPSQGE